MAIYQPYFYVIQDKRNGMYYAGAKWAQDADPSTFMLDGGYQTSSKTIKTLIEHHGINNFSVRKLVVFDTALQAQQYETRFLRRVDAKHNPKFYNAHNNDRANHTKMRIVMMELYGVEYGFQAETVKHKIKQSHLRIRGVENPLQSEEIKEKRRLASLEKYQVEEFFHSKEMRERAKTAFSQKYGVDYPLQSEEIKEKYKNTMIERYGVETPFQSETFKKKNKEHANRLVSRPQLDMIRSYQKRFKIKLGSGWVRKSDEFINDLLQKLQVEYGQI